MKKISEYRDHACECRTMAKRTRSQAQRDMLLKMADTWDGLAEAREQTIASQERIAKLEKD
jgi:hypothetical protein